MYFLPVGSSDKGGGEASGELLSALTAIAEAAGVPVRVERFELAMIRGRGGLCTIGGKRVVLVDEATTRTERIALIATALASLDLEGIEMSDEARAAIDRRRPKRRKRTSMRVRVRVLKPIASTKRKG